MNKLIEQFVANPSDKTRLRLQTYLARHSMAVCLASPEQREILKANNLY